MIPGTLRPLPKKVKEVKTEAEQLLRTVEYDINNTIYYWWWIRF